MLLPSLAPPFATQLWWETAPASLRAVLWTLLADLPSDLPLLLLATADVPASQLDPEALALFGPAGGQHGGPLAHSSIYQLGPPTPEQRTQFFRPLCEALAQPPLPPQAPPAPAPEVVELPCTAQRRMKPGRGGCGNLCWKCCQP